MRTNRSKLSRLLSWGLFLGALFTVGTGFNPGTLTRSGCEDVIDADHLVGLVIVKVVDAYSGEALSGATVVLDDLSGTTGGDGKARFTGLVTGTAMLTVNHAGYEPWSRSVTLVQGEDGELLLRVFMRPLQSADAHPLLVWDTTVFRSDGLTTTHRDDPLLVFESAAATLAHQANAVAYIEPDLSRIPAGATLQSVTLFGQQILDCCSSPPDNGGDNGGGDGGGDAPSRDRLEPRGTAGDEDVALEAYGVLQTWSQDDINYLNQPVDYTETPVATGTIPATAPDNAGLRPFQMDLTQFVTRVRSGVLRAHGFVLTTRDILGTAGTAQALGAASSEYVPAEGALRIVAVYTTAAGRTERVDLR